jgi:CubicO group peptidase (beta-lactamase class C family)
VNMFARVPREVQSHGSAEEPFLPLIDIFDRMMADQAVGGAALAVYHRGRKVVDLVAGDYVDDSTQVLFSVTKAITAIAATHAEEAGLLDLDAPLAGFWPEFAKTSTKSVTSRMVLAHRSGLASLDRTDLTLQSLRDGSGDEAVGRQEPYWEPGTAHGYHSFTYGLLLDGVFRRVLGESVGAYVERELRLPLDLDLRIGAAESELGRVHPTTVSEQWTTRTTRRFAEGRGIPPGTTSYLRNEDELVNDPDFLTASFPAVTGVATARSLARLMAATLGDLSDGKRVLTEGARDRMIERRSDGQDRVLGIRTAFGSGVQLPFPQLPLTGPTAYGHEGANGCLAFADRDLDLAVGFTTSVFPATSGSSIGALALLPSVRLCVEQSLEALSRTTRRRKSGGGDTGRSSRLSRTALTT